MTEDIPGAVEEVVRLDHVLLRFPAPGEPPAVVARRAGPRTGGGRGAAHPARRVALPVGDRQEDGGALCDRPARPHRPALLPAGAALVRRAGRSGQRVVQRAEGARPGRHAGRGPARPGAGGGGGPHDVLRTTFIYQDTEPVQAGLGTGPRTARGVRWRRAGVMEYAREVAEAPYDLAAGPLLRASLATLGARRQALVLGVHHIISDGFSMNLLLDELDTAYRGGALGSGPPSTATSPGGSVNGSPPGTWPPTSSTGAGRSTARPPCWTARRPATPAPAGRDRQARALPARPRPDRPARRGRRAGRRHPVHRAALGLRHHLYRYTGRGDYGAGHRRPRPPRAGVRRHTRLLRQHRAGTAAPGGRDALHRPGRHGQRGRLRRLRPPVRTVRETRGVTTART